MSLENLLYIIKILNDDTVGIKLTAEVFQKALNYVNAVNSLEHYLILKGDDKDEIKRLDQRRTLAHNALIDAIKIANRYLFTHYGTEVIPAGGVYSGDPLHLSKENRKAIGDWAGKLVFEVFMSRR